MSNTEFVAISNHAPSLQSACLIESSIYDHQSIMDEKGPWDSAETTLFLPLTHQIGIR